MLVAVAGERFGHILSMYERIKGIEHTLETPIDWILQIGSFGAFADKARWTKALKKANTPDDFQKIYLGQINVSHRTLIIPGVHDDNNWLYYRSMAETTELAYNLSFIINGFKASIDNGVNILGLGKSFSPKTWNSGIQNAKDLKHYTRREVERACSAGPIDILMTHEPLYGTKFKSRQSMAQGLQKVVYATRPKIVVHRSYDKDFKEYKFLNSQCLAVPAYHIAVLHITNNDVKVICYS